MFVLDATLTDPLEIAAAAIGAVLAEDRDGWTDTAVGERVVALLGVAERARAGAASAFGAFDAAQGWRADDASSAVNWVASKAGCSRKDATRVVAAGRLVRRHERVAKALAAGDITIGHTETMARAARTRRDTFERDTDVLLDAAQTLEPDDFAAVVRRWALFADDQAAEDDRQARHDQRRLHISSLLDGTVRIDGQLDPEGAAIFQAALRALEYPDTADTPAELRRTAEQRRADALVELARRAMGAPTGTNGAPLATVDVIIDADALAGAPVDPVKGTCDIVGFGPIHPDLARQFCCDSWIGRIIMAARSEPLDVGRRSRTFTAAQRRAIIARDRTCIFPGCDRGPDWCDIHHIDAWAHGGHTNIDNGVLICRHDHRNLHNGWTVTQQPDGTYTASPPEIRRRC